MVVKILDRDSCIKIGKILFPSAQSETLYIPDNLFGSRLRVIKKNSISVEVDSGYCIPIQFIGEVKEW